MEGKNNISRQVSFQEPGLLNIW